jgi:homoserine kinase
MAAISADLVDEPVRVRVPATSANLGPGYDTLGVALGLHDLVTAKVTGGPAAPAGGQPEVVIEVSGEGADDVPRDATHLVHRAMVRGFEAMGVPVPGVRLHCANAVPHGRGLGSSSAAIVAGLATARGLVRDGAARLSDDALFALAAEAEGHPDNVAPAVYGGLTIAYGGPRAPEPFRAVRLDVDPAVCFVVFVPPTPLETRVARGLLPSTVPHADAAHNAGRAALMVAALTGRPEALLAATEDRLHQTYRAAAMPQSIELVERLRADGYPAVVSGAGPTVLALVGTQAVPEVRSRGPRGWRAMQLAVDPDGVAVL